MYGERVNGGYEAGFVFTERQAALVRAELDKTDWFKRRRVARLTDANMGRIRFTIRPSIGFAGSKGFRIVARTKDEMETVRRVLSGMNYDTGWVPGQTLRTATVLFPFSEAREMPIGTLATFREAYSGSVRVTFEGDDETVYDCPWYWFEANKPDYSLASRTNVKVFSV